MNKLWLFVAFVAVMLLIGRGWQREPAAADVIDGDRAAATGTIRR
jgi:hypothetical protein